MHARYFCEECLPSLIKLSRCDRKTRQKALEYAPDRLINALSECAMNLLYRRIPLSAKQKNYLKLYKKNLHQVADPRVSTRQRRRVFQQRGGALVTTLLGLALPYIIEFAKNKIFNKQDK